MVPGGWCMLEAGGAALLFIREAVCGCEGSTSRLCSEGCFRAVLSIVLDGAFWKTAALLLTSRESERLS